MPYKKESVPFDGIKRLIYSHKLSSPKLAVILQCSAPTAKKKTENPSLLTLGDLERLSRFGHIEIEQIREAIRF